MSSTQSRSSAEKLLEQEHLTICPDKLTYLIVHWFRARFDEQLLTEIKRPPWRCRLPPPPPAATSSMPTLSGLGDDGVHTKELGSTLLSCAEPPADLTPIA